MSAGRCESCPGGRLGPAFGDGDAHELDVALLTIGQAHVLGELSVTTSSVDAAKLEARFIILSRRFLRVDGA